ncbi:MAG: mechanosensitive ion channel protein MscS [Gemmatimonadales bacterium]|nr:Small-conductance mechanosensitive channel [bacterium HR33]GIW52767.1 MAG: mechanosensitive ion channel protein MscS [Gemmatimonadales bacterium]
MVEYSISNWSSLLEQLGAQIGVLGAKLLLGVALFVPFLAAGWVAAALFRQAARRVEEERQSMLKLAGSASKLAFWTVGAITAMGTAGVNVSALVAGLGLTGFALGFALRDALSNLLAGVLILAYRPFKPGDRISVAGFEGQVSEIDLRYTTLQSETARILIPNSTLFTNTVVVQLARDRQK